MKNLNDFERSFDSDTNYATFGQRFEQGAAKIGQEAAQHIADPKARATWLADFNNRTLSARNRVLDLAAGRQKEARLVNYKSGLEGYQSVIADPNASEEERNYAKRSAEASIDVAQNAGDLSPAEAETWRQNVVKGGEFIYGQRQIEQDPSSIIQAKGPVAGIVAKAAARRGVNPDIALAIAHIESGLDPNAKAGSSSAGGLFQFTDGTAARYGLTNKFDAIANADAGARLTKDNIEGLRRDLGREPTPGEIYLAHFGGYGVAEKLGQASADTPTSTIFSPQAIAANRSILAGKTAGQVRDWADRKMANAIKATGGTSRPEWFTSQSPDKQLQLEQMAQQRQAQIDSRAAAQDKANQAAIRDDYNLRIATSDPTLTRQQILDDPSVDNGDKATLINSLNAKLKDTVDTAAAVQAFAGGALRVDPYAADGKKTVDNVYDALSKVAAPEQTQSLTEELVRQTGTVPSSALNQLRVGLTSTNVADVEAAAQAAQRIFSINPAALERRDGGSQVQQMANDFSHYVRDLNMSPADAATRLRDSRNPVKVAERKTLEPAAKEFLKTLTPDDLAKQFGGSFLTSAPTLGTTPAQALGIQAEYLAIAEDQFYAMNGDPALAKSRALDQMKAMYGVSEFSGGSVVKYPPERYWPKQDTGGGLIGGLLGDPYQYAKSQLSQEIDEISGRGSPGPITKFAGQLEHGNIDLAHRPQVKNGDGSISTVRSMSFEEDGKEILVPTVSPDGKILTDEQAIDLYHKTGQKLGVFDTPEHADAYAQALHQAQERYYRGDLAIDPASVKLVTTPETEADVKAGRLPGYAVMWTDANGNLQTIPGKVWRPDLTHMLEQGQTNRAKAQAEAEKNARQNEKLYQMNILTGEPLPQPGGAQ